MGKEQNALKAGVFILLTVAAVVAGIFLIAGPEFLSAKNVYMARFPLAVDLAGLRVGDDVRLGGSKVGSVLEIEIVPDEKDPHTLVVFAMPERFKLKKDAVVVISPSFTGSAQLNVPVLGSGENALPEDQLTGRGGGISAVLEKLQTLAPKVETAVADVSEVVKGVKGETLPKINSTLDSYKSAGEEGRALISDVRGKINTAFGSYESVMENARAAAKNIGDMIGPGNGDFRGSLANTRELTESLKKRIPELMDKVEVVLGKAEPALETAREALAEFKETGLNAKAVSAEVRDMVTRNKSRIDQTIASVRTTTENLRMASSEIRRSPWRLLYKPTERDMQNQDLFNASREFAEGASQLSEAAGALRDSLKSEKVTAQEVNVLLEDLQAIFEQFGTVEKKLFDAVKDGSEK